MKLLFIACVLAAVAAAAWSSDSAMTHGSSDDFEMLEFAFISDVRAALRHPR